MASWSEEEEVEGSGRRGGEKRVGGWVGGGSLRNWSPPFSAEIFESYGSFQAAALWQKKKKKQKERKQPTTIWLNTISVFKQGRESVRCGSQCWYSPQGWSHWDEKETTVLHNEAACPVGKSNRAAVSTVVNFSLGFALCSRLLTWHWAAERPVSAWEFTQNIQATPTFSRAHILRSHSYMWPRLPFAIRRCSRFTAHVVCKREWCSVSWANWSGKIRVQIICRYREAALGLHTGWHKDLWVKSAKWVKGYLPKEPLKEHLKSTFSEKHVDSGCFWKW